VRRDRVSRGEEEDALAGPTETSRSSPRSLLLRLGITIIAVAAWFWTQSLIGARNVPADAITDAGHHLTAPINHYLSHHPRATDALLAVSSGLIDLLGLFLLGAWIFTGSVRPFLSLLMVVALRQIMQMLCALPPPPGMIWHYPDFPSLLVTYKVGNDFFFSGHTAIAVLGVYELARLRRNWLTAMALLVLLFEIVTVLSLRVHYTMDVFTGLVTALLVSGYSSRLTNIWFRSDGSTADDPADLRASSRGTQRVSFRKE